MKFIARLMGGNGEPHRVETAVSFSGRSPGEPNSERARDELLLRLSAGQAFGESFQSDWWTRVLSESAARVLSRFLQEGLLIVASTQVKFEAKFRISDLKPLLEQRGLKKSGKKSEMVERLLQVLSPAEAEWMVKGLDAYSATSAGAARIEAYREFCKQESAQTDAAILEALLRGDLAGAGRAAAAFEARQAFPRGMGIDWGSGYPQSYLDRFQAILHDPQDALPYPPDVRREIAIRLIRAEMRGQSPRDWAKGVLEEVTHGEFECPDLEEFLRHPTGGYASGFDPDDPGDRAEVYLHTLSFRASAACDLREFRSKKSLGIKGVEILRAGDDCSVCSKGGSKFALSNAPELPRHWGCRCGYIASF